MPPATSLGRAHLSNAGAKVLLFSVSTKFFGADYTDYAEFFVILHPISTK